MKLTHLRVNHMVSPVIDTTPEFSFFVESEKQNVMLAEVRITVQDEESCFWDSGIMTDGRQAFIRYAGRPLQSRKTYRVTIEAKDNYGNCAAGTCDFRTGLFREDWQAQWVESTFARNPHQMLSDGIENPVLSFVRPVTLSKTVAKATMYATCYGAYRLLVNGKRPDEREFAPEFTAYKSILYYQTYDVTALLQKGENTLEMLVGDGWYFNSQTAAVGTDHEKPSILYQLEITYADGTKETIASNGTEICRQTNILYSDLFVGEKIDFTKAWSAPAPVECKPYPLDVLRAQTLEPVQAVKTFSVQKVISNPENQLIFDFGQVIAGRCRIKLREKAGTEVRIHHTEMLNPDGSYFKALSACQRETILCSGDEIDYEPMFTFHGFRYIWVEGAENAKPEDFEAVLLSTPKENKGIFHCDHPEFERLYQNIRYSQRNNMMSIPTDCPQREKAGWTGDVLVYSKTSMLNEEMTPFYQSWLNGLAADQEKDGAIPIISPSTKMYDFMLKKVGHDVDTSTPAKGLEDILPGENGPVAKGELPSVAGWSDVLLWLPMYLYEMTGNREPLRQLYPAMKKYVNSIIATAANRRGNGEKDENDRYLWNTGFHFGEWLVPGKEKPGFEACPETAWYIAPFFGYRSVQLLGQIAEIVGNTEDCAFYTDYAGKMKQAIQQEILPMEKPYAEYMGRYILALAFGLADGKWHQPYCQKLTELVQAKNGKLGTGFLATPFILQVLDDIGRHDLAKQILWQPDCPGWLYEVRMGATSIWENWGAVQPDGTPNKTSFDHYAFGVVDTYLAESICGIRAAAPGFDKIRIEPCADGGFAEFERVFLSEHGPIRVHRRGDTLTVTIPPNTTAEILWNGQCHKTGSGTYVF